REHIGSPQEGWSYWPQKTQRSTKIRRIATGPSRRAAPCSSFRAATVRERRAAARSLTVAARIVLPIGCRSFRLLLLPQIQHGGGEALHVVVDAANVARFGPNADADPGQRFAGFPKHVLAQRDRFCFILNVDRNAVLRSAVNDTVALQPITV